MYRIRVTMRPDRQEPQGDGAGATPAKTACKFLKTSKCFRCTPGEYVDFPFSGKKAATAAKALAEHNPYDDGDDPGEDNPKVVLIRINFAAKMYSAMFMSLAYYAGGLPMVTDRCKKPSYDDVGWHAYFEANKFQGQQVTTLLGNNAWLNHSGVPHVLDVSQAKGIPDQGASQRA